MTKPLFAFNFVGLRVSFSAAALISFGVLALAAAALAGWLAHLRLGPALAAGALSALLFFVFELLHQAGHAVAARLTGYPMRGLHFFSVFARSLYPDDEPDLAPRLHLRRALGGFGVNVVLGLLSWPLAAYLFPRGTEILPPAVAVAGWLAAFSAVTNGLILGLGALVPLRLPGGGLTDGGTLLHYWRELRAE
ncbi:MAG: hypothetical protein IT317_16225 [Anaerolineales bacterium]|nr:hypothetical protein [Anaerolineales bacterium]